MEPVSLEEMDDVKLMNRIDSKFPLCMTSLDNIAPLWMTHYLVQEVENRRVATYKSLYFDTQDALTYTLHHNRHLSRQKIRHRFYVDTNNAFCEVKNKKNNGRTKKKRIQIPLDSWGKLYDFPDAVRFLNDKVWVTDQELFPRLENRFERITLVNKDKSERITIDFNISFHNHVSNYDATADNLAVIEVKQNGNVHSRFKEMMREAHVKQKGLSKYCLGMLLTDPSVKYNRFKNKIHYINKLTNNNFEIKSLGNDTK